MMRLKSFLMVLLMLGFTQSLHARTMSFEKQAFDLDDPSSGFNVFTTVFTFTPTSPPIPVSSSPIQVDYEDEPHKTGIQANLVIDFSDLDNPVVETVEFDGEPGDIEHSFPTASFFILGFEVFPSDVKGFLRTQGGPITVNSDGSFPAGNTNLVARQGMVSIPSLSVNENLNDLPLGEFDDPISDSGDLNSIEIVPNLGLSTPTTRVYDLTIISELDNTLLTFPTTAGDLVFNIDGIFRGTSQITIDVPEPTSFAGAILALGMIGMRRRL